MNHKWSSVWKLIAIDRHCVSSIAKPSKDKEIVFVLRYWGQRANECKLNYFNKVLCNDLKPFNITIKRCMGIWKYDGIISQIIIFLQKCSVVRKDVL